MYVETQLRALSDFFHQIIHGLTGHGTTLTQEEIRRTRIAALLSFSQPGAQSTNLIAFQWLMRREAPLFAANEQTCRPEIEVFQSQINRLRAAEAMPIGQQE